MFIIIFYSIFKGLEKADSNEILGEILIDLDGRFTTVRLMESNMGNFICDLVLAEFNADCVIINSGTIRSDCITSSGYFKVGELKKIIPFPSRLAFISCNGLATN